MIEYNPRKWVVKIEFTYSMKFISLAYDEGEVQINQDGLYN